MDDCKPLRDGTRARAEFGFNGDVLVLMLGDGVDQIVGRHVKQVDVVRRWSV